MKLAKKYNVNIYIFDCDLGIETQLDSLVKKISKEFKIIDTIINSIGMVGTDNMTGWNTSYKNQARDSWQKCLDVNLSSIFFLVKNLYKKMYKSRNLQLLRFHLCME